MSHPILRAAIAALIISLPAMPGAAQETEPGDEWKMTMSMQMEGFSMPGHTSTQCIARSQKAVAPTAEDKNCQSKVIEQSGNTVKVEMVCTGSNAMQGTGTFTTTATGMNGQMQMNSKDGSMTMAYNGVKTGKPCDAKALERQVKATVAQGAAAMDKQCVDMAHNLEPVYFFGKQPICSDAKYRTQFCAAAKGEAAYTKLHGYQTGAMAGVPGEPPLIPQVERACGFTMAAMNKELCSGAEQRKSWSFLAANCEAQAQVLAKRECAGRDFTARMAHPSPYDDFCGAYAAHSGESRSGDGAGAAGPAAPAADKPEEKPAEKPADKVKDRAKKLKGLLGF